MNEILNPRPKQKKKQVNEKLKYLFSFAALLLLSYSSFAMKSKINQEGKNKFFLTFKSKRKVEIEFLKDNIFRIYFDKNGGHAKNPNPDPFAKILVDRKSDPGQISLDRTDSSFVIKSKSIQVELDRNDGKMRVLDRRNGKLVFEESNPVSIDKKIVTQTITMQPNEYFYGGGAQNGRFSHRGHSIAILNENNWEDGGVASPNPFFWSTAGYGIVRNTFDKGVYDFGKNTAGKASLKHNGEIFDAYIFIDETPEKLLKDYYYLMGNPVLLPKFAFYIGHLNAYNRDYFAEVDSTERNAIRYEDGKYYKEYNPVAKTFSDQDAKYIDRRKQYEKVLAKYKKKYGRELEKQYHESLNPKKFFGKDNYMFTAQAAIDRYKNNDMPLGWFLPNDGYGAGYGQGKSLKENIVNLKIFGDYARKNGVELGLWTQSDLETENAKDLSPRLQRSISQEIGDAGVRVLKTDVAWVGAGYSFGLNGIENAAKQFAKYGNNARPFIVTLDGWAGSQRYGAFWTGDQTGGQWSYIDFEIPTYIGEGLSGQPNTGSDMDGIFGGKNPIVNIRDYQWKTFTPIQMNMDGWGSNPKYPSSLGEPATSINRMYLKFKSELIPYIYSVAYKATNGLPMIRPMFIEQPNDYTYGKDTEYQFMFGPYFLVAPVYKNTEMKNSGDDIRNNIYLPKGIWIDYFTGKQYKGEIILNNFQAPIWKLPLFVKNGAIIPMTEPNNNPNVINHKIRIYDLYPMGKTSFTEYDDDGKTKDYLSDKGTLTSITSDAPDAGKTGVATISIAKTKGNFNGFQKDKTTLLRVHLSKLPKKVSFLLNGKNVPLKEAKDKKEFDSQANVFYYSPTYNFKDKVINHPILLIKTASYDVKQNDMRFEIDGFENLDKSIEMTPVLNKSMLVPNITIHSGPKALILNWKKLPDDSYLELKRNGIINTNIRGNKFWIRNLSFGTSYPFEVRLVQNGQCSPWVKLIGETLKNPYTKAVKIAKIKTKIKEEDGFPISNLFDRLPTSLFHSEYNNHKSAPWKSNGASPAEIVVDLGKAEDLNKIVYVPRKNGINGLITLLDIETGNDGKKWTKSTSDINWKQDNRVKVLNLNNIKTRFVKFTIKGAVNGYISGSEIFILKK